MTAFGKILVFMNLLFSVAIGALIVFVFTTRANWKNAYEEAERNAKATEKAYKAEKLSHENDLKQKDAAYASLSTQIASLQNQIDAANTSKGDADKLLATEQTKVTGSQNVAGTVAAEMKQLKEEREKLQLEKDALRQQVVKVQNELVDEKDVRIKAEGASIIQKQKINSLLGQVTELSLKVRELEQIGGGGLVAGTSGGNPSTSVLNPPPKSAPAGVRGTVTAVGSAGTNLAQISIGTDSGVGVGNQLTVFRGSEYLGDLQITNAEPKLAVGKFIPAKKANVVSVGDSVITSFGGSSN